MPRACEVQELFACVPVYLSRVTNQSSSSGGWLATVSQETTTTTNKNKNENTCRDRYVNKK